MGQALRFTTVRIGVLRVAMDDQVFESDVRVLLASDGAYRLLDAGLSEPLSSIEDAVARAEASVPEAPRVVSTLAWRDGHAPSPGEHPCPICGEPARTSPRHPRRLCPACVMEAADAGGRWLRFGNTHLSGGIEARYADDGSLHAGLDCLVRGVRCRAVEGKFGGVVLQPMAD